MENEPPNGSTSSSGPPAPPAGAAYSGIPDRQTVQVIQQALSRQPSTAAQYLQQMYAAQQQHLMMQTAALQQQQHLSAAPPVSRAPSAVSSSQQSPSQTLTIIQRPQTVGSGPPTSSAVAPQAVILGNTPALSSNQAQMYLRAQMLIFTPTVSSAASEVSPAATTQVQTLAVRGGGVSQSQPPGGTPNTPHPTPVTPAVRATGHPQVCSIQPQKPLQIPPRPAALPVTRPCLRSAPITSLAGPEPSSTCAETNGHRQSPATCPAGQEVPAKLLPVILQIPGTSPPAAENPFKRCSSVSPHLVKVQPPVLARSRAAHHYRPQDSAHTGAPGSDPRPPLDMTSGNGSSPIPAAATGNTPQNGENKAAQAVVKPQILTHVIEGFVIQEGAQPFPSHRSRAALEVGRSPLLVESQEKQVPPPEKLPQQDTNTTTDSEMEETVVTASKNEGDPPKLKCELCGRVNFEYKFKRSKRFCSMACAKRYNVGCTKRVGLFHPDRSKLQKPGGAKRRSRKSNLQGPGPESGKQVQAAMSEPITPVSAAPVTPLNPKHKTQDSSRCSDNSSYEEPLSPMSASSSLSRHRRSERALELSDLQGAELITANSSFLPSDPTKWNVEDVYEFIRSLPGCQEISEEFRAQEIDGQALLLLKEDHLMSTMNIKLGPALKLFARISLLRDS